MHKIFGWVVSFLLCAGSPQFCLNAKLPAFPGAEGFGSDTPGGRGGKVLFVTNLDDYLPGSETPVPGSLRAACLAKGPRTVVFEVSGTIPLKTYLKISEPYLTLAGQSAPGGGICVKNYGTFIKTHDVVVRHLRFWPGDEVGRQLAKEGKPWDTDALSATECRNIIIDHCSASWANDEVLSLTKGTDITVQWSFITESLNRSTHAKGAHGYGGLVAYMDNGRVTQHHNLWAFHRSRSPRPGSGGDPGSPGLLYDFRNNVIYQGGKGYSRAGVDKIRMNYVGNTILHSGVFSATPGVNMFLDKNLHNGKETGWAMIRGTYQKAQNPFPVATVKTDSAESAYRRVLTSAGAILPIRDAVDQRIVESVREGTGKLIDTQSQAGGWPILEAAHAPADTDRDGMPDGWELKHGLDPHQPGAGQDQDQDGYTDLEEYLNQTDPNA